MRTVTGFLFTLFLLPVFGQNDSVNPKVLRYIVKATTGNINPHKISFTNAEWERMTPGFTVPDSFQLSSATPFNRYPGEVDFYDAYSFSFITNAKKQSGKKYRLTTVLQAGGGSSLETSQNWFHDAKQVTDTLISSQTGMDQYVIGNRRTEILKTFKTRTVMLGIGQHITTNPARLFRFETGMDVFFLYSHLAEVKTLVSGKYLLEGVVPDNYSSSWDSDFNGSEVAEYKGRRVYGLQMQVPLDISIALSKKRPFFKRVRLGIEWNPGFAVQFTPDKTHWSFNNSGGFNLRYEFFGFRSPFQPKSQKPVSN